MYGMECHVEAVLGRNLVSGMQKSLEDTLEIGRLIMKLFGQFRCEAIMNKKKI